MKMAREKLFSTRRCSCPHACSACRDASLPADALGLIAAIEMPVKLVYLLAAAVVPREAVSTPSDCQLFPYRSFINC